ncbi:type IV secretion system protein [Noviherbaspirillum sp.]|mgnify:CR=1 FL=1|uniref:type IV secretion system protein n=1 Tax=Noviherbaspirillum sp. TaxID=1926288 RepID=UPI002FE1C1A7
MPSNFHFYERTFADLNIPLENYWETVAGNIVEAITPVSITLLSIYFVLWGWAMMRGVISEPVTDGLARILRLSIITGIALSVTRYGNFLANLLWNSPEVMAEYIASGSASSENNMQFLDRLLSQIYDLGNAFWQNAHASSGLIGVPDLGQIAIAILIWASGLLVTGYGAFLLALSKMALAIILGVGPIFILLTIFEPTKRFFDAWLGQALNYVFTVMLTAAAIKLILSILATYLADATAAGVLARPFINQALPCLVLSIIGILVMMQIPSIASSLSGGVAIGTLGAVAYAYQKAKGAAGSSKNLVIGQTLSDMRGARRARVLNARWASNHPSLGRLAVGAPMAVYRKITGSTNRVSRH